MEAAATQDLARTSSPRAATSAEGDSPLRCKLQPVEFFDAQNDVATDLVVLGKYVVVMREAAGATRHQAYTEAGKLATMNFSFPGGRLTTEDVRTLLDKAGKTGISLTDQDFADNLDSRTIAAQIGSAEWDGQRFKETLRRTFRVSQGQWSAEFVHAQALAQADQSTPLLEVEYQLIVLPEQNALIYKSGNAAIVIETRDSTGEQLPPHEWVRMELADLNSVSAEQRKKVPSLKAYQTRKDSAEEYLPSLEQGVLKVTKGKHKELCFSEQVCAFALAKHDKNLLSFVDSQTNQLKTISLDATKGVDTPVHTQALPFKGQVRALHFEPGGNYLVLAVEEEGAVSLKILDRETASVQAEIKNASAKLEVDATGNIYFLDSDGKLRVAQTNFTNLPKGGLAQARSERLAALASVETGLEDLDLAFISPGRRVSADSTLKADALLERAQRKLLDRFEPAIDKAESLEALIAIIGKVEVLREHKRYENFPEIFEPVEARIRSKTDQIRVGAFRRQLDALTAELPEIDTPGELVRLDQESRRLGRARRDLVIFDPAQRVDVDLSLKSIRARVQEVHAVVQAEVSTSLEQRLVAIQEKLRTVATIPELQLLQGEKECLDFSELLSVVRDPSARQDWQQRYRLSIDQRKSTLLEEIAIEEEAERKSIAQAIEEAQQILQEIKEHCEQIGDLQEFAAFKATSPLLKKLKAKIATLPEEYKGAEEDQVRVLVENKERSLAARSALGASVHSNEVTFGKESFPIFRAPPLVWQPKVVPLHEGNPMGMLVYQSNLGHLFPAPCDPVSLNLEHPDTKAALTSTRGAADAFFDSVKRKPPGFDSNWALNDFYRDRLDAIARISRRQLQHQRGILILESEAGAGKNVLVDMFGHFTNREVHLFACNFQTEKEDLTTAFKFDPKKGTYSLDAELLRKLQTPGAIICFDEINALPTGVTKLLNPALDYRRALYLPDGRVIKIDPSVIILGTMNPQNYLGVKQLSPEVKSRARILPVPYPPEKVGAKYAPYEAEILAKHVSHLKGLKQDEFYALWDFIANADSMSGGDRHASKDREKATKEILQIVKSANRVREAHNAFKSGKSTEPVTMVFSMRETIDIASEIGGKAPIKEVIKEVVLPKIGDLDERERVGIVIDQS